MPSAAGDLLQVSRDREEVGRLMFRASKWPVFLVALLLFSEACAYIVLPEGLEFESLGDFHRVDGDPDECGGN